MHIKEMKIKGFMSIKDEVIWSDLHSGINVIAGQNGSGKSTFLRAIRFVFTNDFPCLTHYEKQLILNDGKNVARVDIIIDNSDNRFLMENEIVRFSRHVEMKKDSYFLNNKRIGKSEFYKLLELAWFSIKQPIYIVPQGYAKRLAMISNEARLEILEEAARYKYFKDIKRLIYRLEEQSDMDMQFFTRILERFEEELEFIKLNIVNLEEYNRLKKKVDAIKIIITNRQLVKIENELQNWEQKEKKKREKRIELNNHLCEAIRKVEKLSDSLNRVEKLVETMQQKKKDYTGKEQVFKGDVCTIKLEIIDTEEESKRIEKDEKKAEVEIENLNCKIKEFEDKLATCIPEYEQAVKELERINQELVVKEAQVDEVYAKKGRAHGFSDQLERDNWIENELSVLRTQITESEAKLEKLNQQIEIDEKTKTDFEKEIKSLEGQIEMQKTAIKLENEALHNLTKEKTDIWKKSTNLRDQLNEKEQELSAIESKLSEVQGKFKRLVLKRILDAIVSVQRILEVFRERDEDTNGYVGLLIDVFRIKNESTHLAIENVAGNHLFEHVVELENLATRIIEEMNKLDLPGEANFFPLDRLRYSNVQSTPDAAINMMSLLEYDSKFDGAIRTVFGNMWICRNLDSAYEIAMKNKIGCITLEGDKVFSNGNLYGGAHDSSNLRLEVYARKVELEKEVKILRNELDGIREQIKEVDQKKVAIENQISKLTTKMNLANDNYRQMKNDFETRNSELNSLVEHLAEQRKLKEQQKLSLQILRSKISSLQSDLNQELSSELSEEEGRQLQELLALRKEKLRKTKAIVSLKENKDKLESFLNDKLKKEAEYLMKLKENYALLKQELKQNIESLRSRLIEFQERDVLSKTILRDFNATLDKTKNQKKNVLEELNMVKPIRERCENDLRILDAEIAKNDLKIKELRDQKSKFEEEISSLSFSRSVVKNFERIQTKELARILDKSRKKLNKMKLNPRAQELHDEINKFKEEFQAKMQSLNLPENFTQFMSEINDLAIETLEEKFTEFSRNFDKYFKRFVPEGKGTLIKCGADLQANQDDTFTGIDVNVTFSGREKENLNSLSGGEKSIVSLALIFAVVENNPPPFFIFDEVDAALSTLNVEILAGIINEISATTQVFISTFNRQMMEREGKYFKVISRNSIAHIKSVSSVEELLDYS